MKQTNLATNHIGQIFCRLLLLIAIAGNVSCTPSDTKQAGGGGSGSGISQGSITGFGSIFMNGIEFDTHDTKITIDGVSVLESDLHVGMVGTVIGKINTATSSGVAVTVDIAYNLVGTVNYINIESRALVVAGQLAIVNPLAVFQNGSLETLRIGDRVAVNGLADTNGTLFTSYVKIIPSSELVSAVISGSISKLDTNTKTFQINNQPVNYANAGFVAMLEASLANDLTIKVVGNQDALGVLQAESVQDLSVSAVAGATDIIVMLEGFTTTDPSTGAIKIGNNTISTGPETTFVNGGKNKLFHNRVRVLGRIMPLAPTTIVAERVEFLGLSTDITFIGNVKSVYQPANLVIVSGIPVVISDATRMLDVSDRKEQKFTLRNIGVGDQLTVYGYKTEHSVTALILRRDSTANITTSSAQNNNVILRGRAATPNPFTSNISVGSMTVDTSLVPELGGFLDKTLKPVSRSEFMASLPKNPYVEVQGVLSDALTLTATSIRLLRQSNMTFFRRIYELTAGRNDLVVFWDGSLNTEQDLANGTTFVNMYITHGNESPYFGFTAHDIRVFGPGTYTFDTCAYNAGRTECGLLKMTVGPDQVGAHMLYDIYSFYNVSVINVWNKDQVFCSDVPNPLCHLFYESLPDGEYDTEAERSRWNLVSTDNDNDGFPGVFTVDSFLIGKEWQDSINFNLNYY